MVSEIPKKVYKIVLGLIALSLSLTSVFATLSTVNLFSSPTNIQVGEFTEDPTNPNHFSLPLQINNTGFYDLRNVTITIEFLIYNATDRHIFMNEAFPLADYRALTSTPQTIRFTNNSFIPTTKYWELTTTTFNATFTIDLYYMFDLMHFTASYNRTLTNLGDFLL